MPSGTQLALKVTSEYDVTLVTSKGYFEVGELECLLAFRQDVALISILQRSEDMDVHRPAVRGKQDGDICHMCLCSWMTSVHWC